MKFCIILIMLFSSLLCFSRNDSLNYRVLGVESGYFNYSSIDELFSPFVYSGSTVKYGIFTRKYKHKSRHEFRVGYLSMLRKPDNISIPEYYYITAYDSQKKFKVKSEEIYSKLSTTVISFSYSYLRKPDLHIISRDQIFIGFINDNDIVFRNYIEDHELISLKISPMFLYEIAFNDRNRLMFRTSIALIGINLRKPYAVATAQVSDSSENFTSIFLNYSEINFINSYLNIYTRINYEKRFSKSITGNIFYDFSYLSLKEPRKLNSVSNSFGLGIFYKF